jgi:predicted RNase H-like HicB family nuclease
MDYRVVLVESDEGFSVTCPALRGCHSQGSTLDEALENIKSAIRD